MSDRAKDAWSAVDERFTTLGRMLADHYRALEQERSSTPEEDRRRIEDAVKTVTRQVDQAFTAFGETIRDPDAKQALGGAAKSLGDALAATFVEVTEEIRKRVRPGQDEGTTEEPTSETGAPDEPPADTSTSDEPKND